VLDVVGIEARYGPVVALRGISLRVGAGEIVALIGANGAGKSTLTKVIAGIMAPAAGSIAFNGRAIERAKPRQRIVAGLSLVPEGRQIFTTLTVKENLLLGLYSTPIARVERDKRVKEMCKLFPILAERLDSPSGNLSGGQQQMLAIARGFISTPTLLLDETSLGLSPKLTTEVFATLETLRSRGISILLSEQNARASLMIADRGYVLELGSIVMSGTGSELRNDPELARRYLGSGARISSASKEREERASQLTAITELMST
jgi:branched-chain amino acid transport system ATP-binding protein